MNAFDVVLEFPDIARPVPRLQHGDDVVGKSPHGLAGRQGVKPGQVFHQFRNVFTAFRQSGHPNRNHAEPVVEIFPEMTICDEARQVAAGRGDHPHVDLHLLGAAHALERLVHQHSENFSLCFQRHVCEFVDVERSAMGLLEGAHAACRALVILDAEKLLLHALRRHGGGTQRNEGAIGAKRQRMERPCSQLLARPHGAGDQHAAVGGRDLLQQLPQLPHGVRTAQQLGVGSCFALERLIFPLQAEGFERAADNQQQTVRLEGLLDVLVGTALDGCDGRFDIAVAGDDDDRNLGVLLLDDIEEIEAVELRAHQPDVEDDERRPTLPRLQTVPRRCCGQDASRTLHPAECRQSAHGYRFRRRRSECQRP